MYYSLDNSLQKFPRVEKLTTKTASQINFLVDGRNVTIAQYFKDTYRYTLKYPNLPCIWVSPKEKKTYIPMEVWFYCFNSVANILLLKNKCFHFVEIIIIIHNSGNRISLYVLGDWSLILRYLFW